MANDANQEPQPPPRRPQPGWVPDQVWDMPRQQRNNALLDSPSNFVPPPTEPPLPPAVSNATLSGASIIMMKGGGELTLTGAPVTVGKVAIANRDAILVQARSIE